MTSATTSRETARLAALQRYEIKDAPETEFSDIIRLAAQICDMPMAAISIVDGDEVWLKAELGVGIRTIPLEHAFCRHTVADPASVMVVSDLSQDTRFETNPLVTGEQAAIKFYAGASLETADGYRLGSICVLDRQPRSLQPSQREALVMLSRQVMTSLELRLSRRRLKNTVESVSDALFTLDHDFVFTYLNPRAELALARNGAKLLGTSITALCELGEGSPFLKQFRNAVITRQPVAFEEFYHDAGLWLDVRAYPSEDGLTVYFQDVTERRQREEQLRLLQNCIARVNDIVIITESEPIDEPGPRILYVNDEFVRRTGYTREEVLGKSPRILQGPKTQREALDRIRTALEARKPVREELINYTKSGEEFWLEIDIVPIAGETGGCAHQVAIQRDITERKRAELAANIERQKYERQHAALVAITHEALRNAAGGPSILSWITQTVARALHVQRVSFWRFNADKSAIVCQDLFELGSARHSAGQELQVASYPQYFRALAESDVIPAVIASQDERTQEFEENYLKPLGITSLLDAPIHVGWKLDGMLWIEHVGPPREWTHAEQSFAVSVSNLVSLVLSQEALSRSEMRLRTIVESEPECIKVVSREGKLLDMNPAGLGMIEADDLESVLHSSVSSLVHPSDLAAYEALHNRACEGGTGQLTFRIISLKGTVRWVEAHFTPLPDADGQVRSVLGVTRDISARKEAMETLRASEASMAIAQSIAHFGSWELDLVNQSQPGALRWSNEMYRIAGYEPGSVEISNDLFFKLAHPEDHATIKMAVSEAIEKHKRYSTVHRLIRPDGEERIVHETAQIFYDEKTGMPVKMVGTAHDITDQRRAEAALRASEHRFRAFMSHSPLACWVVDISGVMRYVSPGYYRMIGVKQDITGQNIRDVFDPDIAEVYLANNREAIEGRRVVEVIEPGIRTDGSRGEVLVVKFPIVMPGEESMLGGIAVDITERKRTEEKLREQATLLDKARDAIIVRSLDHEILYWNQSAERLYGYSAQEALGRSIEELLYRHPADFHAATHAAVTKGEWVGELQQFHKNGEMLIVECHWTLVRDEEGKPKSILAINTDITQRKKLEGQFLRAQRMESIGTLAGGIAHDLNNVLAPIMLSIDLLKLRVKDKAVQDTLVTIGQSAQRGAEMISQVLSFARGMEGRRVEVQMRHIVRDLMKIAVETFPKNITVDQRLSPDLWTIEADPTQVHQVLLNLCVNARDAMPGGGQIIITAENMTIDEHYAAMNIEARVGPHVRIEVEDSGTGIPKDIIDKIFDPFFTTKEVGKGTGLGLSTTLAIVKSHGGFIRVYSDAGMGSKFRVYLPAQSMTSEVSSTRFEVDLPRGDGETVLVVDDEASVRHITRQTLEAFGYRVLLASDGSEAVSLYVQHQAEIAVVLTDMMMPVMDGPATIRVLLRLNKQVRIIAASGITANGKVAQSVDAGVKRFLPKPYTAETLLKAIRQALTESP